MWLETSEAACGGSGRLAEGLSSCLFFPCSPVKEKMSGGEGVNYLQAPTSFPQATSYFKHCPKKREGLYAQVPSAAGPEPNVSRL